MGLFDLHCHSKHSRQAVLPTEGIPDSRDMVRTAKQLGLSGIAITDHNTVAGWQEAKEEAKKQNILFIPGEEIDTARGHLVALGITEHVPRNLSVLETVERIHQQGGIAIASHPYDIKGDGIKDEACHVDAMEAWNAISIDRFSNYLNNRRAEQFGKPKVSGTDAHTLEMIGTAPNRMEAQTLDEVLRCIRKGKVEITRRYIPIRAIQSWSLIRFQKSYDDAIEHIQNYSRPRAWLAQRMLNRFVADKNQRFFTALAHFGVCSAAAYSAVLTAARY